MGVMMLNMVTTSNEDHLNSRFNSPFISLRNKNFRLYIICMCISMIGTWMQNIAQPWLAYTITNSPLLLSLVGALQMFPVLIFSLFAGVIIDHYPKKTILLLTQSASVLITLTLAILVWTGRIQYWHILVLSTLLGTINSLDIPARQAFVSELVERDLLMNAVALNSTIFNMARIVGPALAGLAMGYLGIAFCFLLNSISFTFVIICLLFIKPHHAAVIMKSTNKVLYDIKNGLSYIFQTKILFNTLISTSIVTMFAMNYSVLIPVFSSRILNQQEQGFGFLMSFMGVGSLIGALMIAITSKSGPNKFIYNVVPFFSGALIILTAFVRNYMLTSVILAVTGFTIVAFTSTTNSLMQIYADDEYRGRVMSIYNLVFSGTAMVGQLLAGYIANNYGADIGFAACGTFMFIFLLVAFLIKRMNNQGPISPF